MVSAAVIGPGAVGGAIAALLAQNKNLDLTLCARSPIRALHVETPFGVIACEPRALTDPDRADQVDYVVVATKAYDSAVASRWLARLSGPKTEIFILQNGVDQLERWRPLAPGALLVPAIVDLPCTRKAPGRIRMRRAGSIQLPEGPEARAFAGLIDHPAVEVALVEDFTSAAWRKLCYNCAGAVAVVTRTAQGISRQPSAAQLISAIVAECVAVGRAHGAVLEDELPEKVVSAFQAAPAEGVNSMLADRLAGRPLEVAIMNGIVVRKGADKAIPTPVNSVIVGLLEALSDGAADKCRADGQNDC